MEIMLCGLNFRIGSEKEPKEGIDITGQTNKQVNKSNTIISWVPMISQVLEISLS